MASALPDYVTEQKNTAQQLGAQAGQTAAKSYNIQDELKNIMDEFTKGGKTEWSGIQGQTMSDYLQAPTQARANYYDPESPNYIFNPAKAQRAISTEVGAAEAPMLAASNLMGLFKRGEADIIGAQTRDFQAKAAAEQAAATAARQAYSDTLAEFQWQQSVDFQQEQFDYKKTQDAISNSRSGQTSYAQQEAENKKRVMKEASQAGNDEDKVKYISSEGYSPEDPAFAGIFTPRPDMGATKQQAEIIKGAGGEYTYDPTTNEIKPVAKTGKWWNPFD